MKMQSITDIGKPADLRDSLSTDPKASGQLVNTGDGVAIKTVPLLDTNGKPRLDPDGKPMLDVETVPAASFKAGFTPGAKTASGSGPEAGSGSESGTFTAKPDPNDKTAKPGETLVATQITKSDVHVSTAENPITTSKDIVFS